MNIEKAIETMEYNKHLLGLPEQGETWKENANTIACDLAISALEKQLSSGWIPVSERLPEKSGKYLITIKNLTGFEIPKEYVFICDYFHAIKEFMFDTWEDNKIVAWQPLPEPYKEAKQ